jgi:hypothetical protein
MPHVVKYTESERGWGGEVWYRGFNTKDEAIAEVEDTNKDLPEVGVPEFYIIANYHAKLPSVPKGYKF